MRNGIHRKSRSGARPVLDDDLLMPKLRQTISDDARRQISAATGRKTDEQPDHA